MMKRQKRSCPVSICRSQPSNILSQPMCMGETRPQRAQSSLRLTYSNWWEEEVRHSSSHHLLKISWRVQPYHNLEILAQIMIQYRNWTWYWLKVKNNSLWTNFKPTTKCHSSSNMDNLERINSLCSNLCSNNRCHLTNLVETNSWPGSNPTCLPNPISSKPGPSVEQIPSPSPEELRAVKRTSQAS